MKRTKLTVTIITILTAASFALTVNAKNGNGRGKGNRDMVLRMAEHLNLTAEQKTKIEKLVEDSKKSTKADREKLKSLRQKMRTAWQTENPDRNKIIKIHNKIHALRGKMALKRIDLRLSVQQVLTKEQKQQAAAKMKQHNGQRAGWMDDGPDGCRCGRGNRRGNGRGNRRGNR